LRTPNASIQTIELSSRTGPVLCFVASSDSCHLRVIGSTAVASARGQWVRQSLKVAVIRSTSRQQA
jgi:hypothetical protein